MPVEEGEGPSPDRYMTANLFGFRCGVDAADLGCLWDSSIIDDTNRCE